MNRRKLIDVDIEQTGKAPQSSSYQTRQANSDTAKRRGAMSSYLNKAAGVSQFNPYPQATKKNPATGQNWFETPSAEYQAWEDKNRLLDLEDRVARDDQEFRSNMRRLEKFEPKKNDEAIRTLGNELQTRNKALGSELAIRLPYSSFEQNLVSMRQAGVNAANMTSSISGAYSNSVSRLNPVSMGL